MFCGWFGCSWARPRAWRAAREPPLRADRPFLRAARRLARPDRFRGWKVAGCPYSFLLSAHAEAAGHLDADAARKVVRELATRLDVESKFGLAGTQDGLHLRVALEALGHPRHLLGHLASAAMISVSLEGIALLAKLAPPFRSDERRVGKA